MNVVGGEVGWMNVGVDPMGECWCCWQDQMDECWFCWPDRLDECCCCLQDRLMNVGVDWLDECSCCSRYFVVLLFRGVSK